MLGLFGYTLWSQELGRRQLPERPRCKYCGDSVTFANLAAQPNGDGAINVLDLIELLLNFGVAGCAPTDVNDDGTTTCLDLIDLLLAFGVPCP